MARVVFNLVRFVVSTFTFVIAITWWLMSVTMITSPLTALRKLERNIHDGPQQRLVRLPIDLDRAAHEIEEDPKAAQAIVHSSIVQAWETLDELRALSRAIAPPILTDCAA